MKAFKRSDSIARFKMEEQEGWHNLIKCVQEDTYPSFNFDPEWQVQILPPFARAAARFRVGVEGAMCSIYLDTTNALGYFGDGYGQEVYWELYPYEGDVFRCGFNETEELTAAIRKSIKDQLESKS